MVYLATWARALSTETFSGGAPDDDRELALPVDVGVVICRDLDRVAPSVSHDRRGRQEEEGGILERPLVQGSAHFAQMRPVVGSGAEDLPGVRERSEDLCVTHGLLAAVIAALQDRCNLRPVLEGRHQASVLA
jgi:hypothetical protein